MDKSGRNALGDLETETIKQIAIDFIINGLTYPEAEAKYNVTKGAYYHIREAMGLIKKREDYKKKVLEKALNRLAAKQSKILVDAVEIMLNHVSGVKQLQKEGQTVLPTSVINDIMKIAALISNEKRLDEGKTTENIGVKVIVEMPDVMIIGSTPRKPDIIAQAQPVEAPKVESAVEPAKEQPKDVGVKVEDEPIGIL